MSSDAILKVTQNVKFQADIYIQNIITEVLKRVNSCNLTIDGRRHYPFLVVRFS